MWKVMQYPDSSIKQEHFILQLRQSYNSLIIHEWTA